MSTNTGERFPQKQQNEKVCEICGSTRPHSVWNCRWFRAVLPKLPQMVAEQEKINAARKKEVEKRMDEMFEARLKYVRSRMSEKFLKEFGAAVRDTLGSSMESKIRRG